MNNNRIEGDFSLLIDVNRHAFVHNFDTSFYMNMLYIDKVKPGISHVVFVVVTRRERSEEIMRISLNRKNILVEIEHKYVSLIPEVYANEMRIPYK